MTLGIGAAMQVLIPLAPPVPWVAMAFLIATQVVGDGVLTVYLVNETTLRQRLLPPRLSAAPPRRSMSLTAR